MNQQPITPEQVTDRRHNDCIERINTLICRHYNEMTGEAIFSLNFSEDVLAKVLHRYDAQWIVERRVDGSFLFRARYLFHVSIRHPRTEKPMLVCANSATTVGELKRLYLSLAKDITNENIVFKNASQVLDDDTAKLRDYYIHNGASLSVFYC